MAGSNHARIRVFWYVWDLQSYLLSLLPISQAMLDVFRQGLGALKP